MPFFLQGWGMIFRAKAGDAGLLLEQREFGEGTGGSLGRGFRRVSPTLHDLRVLLARGTQL